MEVIKYRISFRTHAYANVNEHGLMASLNWLCEIATFRWNDGFLEVFCTPNYTVAVVWRNGRRNLIPGHLSTTVATILTGEAIASFGWVIMHAASLRIVIVSISLIIDKSVPIICFLWKCRCPTVKRLWVDTNLKVRKLTGWCLV